MKVRIKRLYEDAKLPTKAHDDDAGYGYTEQDEKEWDEFCKSMYGTNLKGE